MPSALLIQPYRLNPEIDQVGMIRWAGVHQRTEGVRHYLVGMPIGYFQAQQQGATHEIFIGYRGDRQTNTIYRVQRNFGLIPGLLADKVAFYICSRLVHQLAYTTDSHKLLTCDMRELRENYWGQCLIRNYQSVLKMQLSRLKIDTASYKADPVTYIKLYRE